MEITATPLQTGFRKFGDTFTQIAYNPETEMYLYRREQLTGTVYYEVFRHRVNSQGNVSYPKDEGFGRWAKCCRNLEDAKRYLNYGF